MHVLTTKQVRRLALARAGLLASTVTDLPSAARGKAAGARQNAHAIIDRFGYLQLDTVSIAGARSHAIVLLSRLRGMAPELGEDLLRPGEPIFEYWGHEACWLPMDLYPAFEFRRLAFCKHPWWGDVLGAHRKEADRLMARLRDEGPLRALDMEGAGSRGWWEMKEMRRVAAALWSSGDVAIRERVGFQRSFDLRERVIPAAMRERPLPLDEAMEVLALRALEGHGFATLGLVAATWRLKLATRAAMSKALARLAERGDVARCSWRDDEGRSVAGFVLPAHLEALSELDALRPRSDRGVLLSPFDPVLWDRPRVARLFGFEQLLEIFKPAAQRRHGYYCLPVLAGERLVARFDLAAERKRGTLRVLSARFERDRPPAADVEAARHALARFAGALELSPLGWSRASR